MKQMYILTQKLLVLLTVAMLLPSCQKNDKPAKSEKTLRLAINSEPLGLDPRVGGDRKSMAITRHLFEGLMRFDEQGTPTPALCESFTISDDKCTYIFRLKDSLWSTGVPVTASDFEYSWKTFCEPNFATKYSYAFYVIKNARKARFGECSLNEVGVKALDDHTLVVTLEHPAPYFLDLCANGLYAPICKSIDQKNRDWGKNGGVDFISNGPFTLQRWAHQNEIVLKKNPHYYDADSVKMNTVKVAIVEDPQTTLAMFENGDLDWVGDPFSLFPLESIPALIKQNKMITGENGAMYWYLVNTQHPLLRSSKIRKAFAYAINRKTLCEHLLQGNEQAVYSLLPKRFSLLEKPTFQDNDLQIAQKLFNEGLEELQISKDALPKITLCHYADPREKVTSQAVQQQLEKAFGVTIELSGADWATSLLRAFTPGQYDLAHSRWFSWYRDPIYNLEFMKFRTGGLNSTYWENPRYIELLNLSDTETDEVKRNQLLSEAERVIMEDLPLIPVYSETYKYMKKPEVTGEFFTPLGFLDYKKVDIQ